MTHARRHLTRTRQRGGTITEVLLLVAVVVTLGALAMATLGGGVTEKASREADCIQSMNGCTGGSGGAPGGGGGDLASAVGSSTSSSSGGPGGTPDPAGAGAPPGKSFMTGTGDVIKGFFVDGLWGTATGLVHAVAHPIDTVTGVASAVVHPVNTFNAVKGEVVKAWNENPQRVIGAGIFEIVTLPLGPAKAAKAEKLVKAARIAEEIERVAAAEKAAAAAEKLAAAEKAASAAEKLAAAEKAEKLAAAEKAAAVEKAEKAAAVEKAAVEAHWPEKYPPPAAGARILSTQRRAAIGEITGSVQGEVKASIVEAKKAEIKAILDGAPGAPKQLPQVKVVPDPHNPGGWVAIDQNHTLQAYKELGFTEIPTQAYTEGGVEWLKSQHSYNPETYFPIQDMHEVPTFTGTPAEQLARRAAGKP